MKGAVVLDTNILIGILNGRLGRSLLSGFNTLFVSTVTVMELYAYAGMSEREEYSVDAILGGIVCEPVSFEIARRAGTYARTRRSGKPDLLIAATAVELGVPLMTKDARGFKNIPGLTLV